jgi:hypothetical protein
MIIEHVSPKLEISKNLAIVGSCAKLKLSKYGDEIDSFDDVLRFNRAPTEGYEEIAGSKTTVRITNGHVFMSMPFTRWEEDQNFVRRLRDTRLIVARGPELIPRRDEAIDKSIELFQITQSFDQILKPEAPHVKMLRPRRLKITVPTVGLMGIMLMVNSGLRPVVYGWSTSADEPMSHYFNNRSPTTSNYHKWETEMALVQHLIKTDKIEVRK